MTESFCCPAISEKSIDNEPRARHHVKSVAKTARIEIDKELSGNFHRTYRSVKLSSSVAISH